MRTKCLYLIVLLYAIPFFLSAQIAVTVGNGDMQSPRPIDLGWRFSLYETIYLESELQIFALFCGVSFQGNFMAGFTDVPIQVFIGSTTQTSLTDGWIPSSQLTQVYNGVVNMNTGHSPMYIPFDNPYVYSQGNLVLMVYMPQNLYLCQSQMFDCQSVGANRARFVHSDVSDYNPTNPPAPTAGQLSGVFPQTTFYVGYYPLNSDLSIGSLSGNPTPVQHTPTVYCVNVGNMGVNTQSQYTIKLYKTGDIELASLNGSPLSTAQNQYFLFSWTPAIVENTTIYAKVFLTNDENNTNNQTSPMSIIVQPQGAIIDPPIPIVTSRIPVDMYYCSSLFETIFTPFSHGFYYYDGGYLITGLNFYNNFISNILNKPIHIWLGNTTQANLSDGWIPASELSLVFDGNVDFPMGINTIPINFQTPFLYTGDNLAMMVQRPLDQTYYSYEDKFYCYDANIMCSRKLYSDTSNFDPFNPAQGGTLSSIYPKTAFITSPIDWGTVNGFVRDTSNHSLNNATVEIAGTGLSTTTYNQGIYNFPFVPFGEHQITAAKTGFVSLTQTLQLNGSTPVTLTFNLQAITTASISGRVMNSNNPTQPVSNAMIALTGESTASTTTDENGYFQLNSVPVNHAYVITISHANYIESSFTFELNFDPIILEDVMLVPIVNNSTQTDIITVTSLDEIFPNPMVDKGFISYNLDKAINVTLEIFNIKGQKVSTIVDGYSKAGKHNSVWNGVDTNGKAATNGIYYCKMTAGSYSKIKKLVLLR